MSDKAPAKVFVSFFDVCLSNFPEGESTHRLIPPDAARKMIDDARRDKALRCVAYEDYNAPYKKREKNKCLELCSALKKHHDIFLSFDDFQCRDEEKKFVSIFPLDFVKIKEDNQLLVINCAYSLKKKSKKILDFEIAPDTIEFHLFAANKSASRPSYTLDELLAQCDPKIPMSQEDREWLSAALGGREDWDWNSKTDEVKDFLINREDEAPQERKAIKLMIKGKGSKKPTKKSVKRKIKARSGRK